MQAITARHSLSPRSLTRSTNSAPCGLPAVSQYSVSVAVSRAYHVPVPADPIQLGLSVKRSSIPRQRYDGVPPAKRGATRRVPFGLGLLAASAHHQSRGLSTIHICCTCGTCLASTPHCGSQRHHVSSPSRGVFRRVHCPWSFRPGSYPPRLSK